MRWLHLLWPCLLLAPAAFGQTPRALFDEGAALYGRGEYEAAAEKFEASFALRPAPVTKFNAARAWEQAGQTLKAIGAFQAWLTVSPQAEQRAEVERAIERLGQRLAALGLQAVTVTSTPAGAHVTIDEGPAGMTPVTVELTPIQHRFRLEAAGRAPVERAVTVPLGRPTVEVFELSAVTPPAPLPAPLPMHPPAPVVNRPTALPLYVPSVGGGPTVFVHIKPAGQPLGLWRIDGSAGGECMAPCDIRVSRPGERFRVEGPGLRPSADFTLTERAVNERLTLEVRPAASWRRPVAIALTAVGLAAAALGGGLMALDPQGYPPSAVTTLGLGVGASLASIYLWLTSTTKVDFVAD